MRIVTLSIIVICLSCENLGLGQGSVQRGFRRLTIDAGKSIGEIRSFQGLNGSPKPLIPGLPSLVDQYRELRVNQVRTHDLMGPSEIDSRYEYHSASLTWLIPDFAERAAFVHAGNGSIIFPNWNADADKSESYNFGPTDEAIAAIRASGAEVYYRIGRSCGANVDPPADYAKFANIVKHIAMHYNQGWANGFHDSIRYWEVWNEPESFWSGTPEQFYDLYDKTARALKSVDPNLKVGGDASAFPYDDGPWREGFLEYCKRHAVPLDFFSWHWYANASADPYDVVRLGKDIRSVLDAHGYSTAESILSEWNLSWYTTFREAAELQSSHSAAFVAAVLTYLQDSSVDHAHFYRGDAAWMGLFDLNGQYFKPAYVFKAMGQMLNTPERVEVLGTDTFGYVGLAGVSRDRRTVQILLGNYARPDNYSPLHIEIPAELLTPGATRLGNRRAEKSLPNRPSIRYADNAGYQLTVDHLPWAGGKFSLKRYRINERESMNLVEDADEPGSSSLTITHELPINTVELIVLQRE